MRFLARKTPPKVHRKTRPGARFDALLGPALTNFWEILWLRTLLFGQFQGSTHQLNGQFHGICLKES